MTKEQLLFILGKHFLPFEALDNLKAIYQKESDPALLATSCYNYGVIKGKRAERAKRKKLKLINGLMQQCNTVKGGDVA